MHACLNEMADEIALNLEENTYQLEPAEDEVFVYYFKINL